MFASERQQPSTRGQIHKVRMLTCIFWPGIVCMNNMARVSTTQARMNMLGDAVAGNYSIFCIPSLLLWSVVSVVIHFVSQSCTNCKPEAVYRCCRLRDASLFSVSKQLPQASRRRYHPGSVKEMNWQGESPLLSFTIKGQWHTPFQCGSTVILLSRTELPHDASNTGSP